jgi:prepilin-type N-terminal cleavage/methylation domain-containing protein
MKKNSGFSLIEMLVVVAIMSVLTAIAFPAIVGMKQQAGENNCVSNMHAIWSALRQYRLDEGRYPDQLLAENTYTVSGTTKTKLTGLYPEYIKSLRTLTCPQGKDVVSDLINTAYGTLSPSDRDAKMQIAQTVKVWNVSSSLSPVPTKIVPLCSYEGRFTGDASNYTNARLSTTVTTDVPFELHYLNGWLVDDPDHPSSSITSDKDYRRQLSMRYPLEDTVVTWCSYHHKLIPAANFANPDALNKRDIILWLDGHVKKVNLIYPINGWRTEPPTN